MEGFGWREGESGGGGQSTDTKSPEKGEDFFVHRRTCGHGRTGKLSGLDSRKFTGIGECAPKRERKKKEKEEETGRCQRNWPFLCVCVWVCFFFLDKKKYNRRWPLCLRCWSGDAPVMLCQCGVMLKGRVRPFRKSRLVQPSLPGGQHFY